MFALRKVSEVGAKVMHLNFLQPMHIVRSHNVALKEARKLLHHRGFTELTRDQRKSQHICFAPHLIEQVVACLFIICFVFSSQISRDNSGINFILNNLKILTLE